MRTESGIEIWGASRNRILPAFACVAALFASGCRKPVEPQSTVAIDCAISPQPVRIGPAILNVKLRDAAGKPVAGARVNVEADMSHPGMAPLFADAKEIAAGQYQGALEFAMPGDWFVLIHVTLPDGRKLERQLNVPGVTSN
jgi:hypothetical protein